MALSAAPHIRHRHSVAEVADSFADAEAAFAAGNHVIAASLADARSPLRGAALVMLGAYRRGLALLDAAADLSPLQRCIRALALWQTGRAGDASDEMRELATRHPDEPLYSNCLAILERTAWNVLLFSNPFSRSVAAFRETSRSSPFRVHIAGFDEGCDIRLRHDRALGETLAAAGIAAPDLALNLTSYGSLHQDFGLLACPKIGFITDHDYFLFNRHAVAQHDLLISNGPVEHHELRLLHARPVHTYYTLDLDYQLNLNPPPEGSGKEIDVGLTGSSLVPYMREKAQLVLHLLDLPDDLTVRILQGFLPAEDYNRMIRRCRLMPMAVRFSDLLNTRMIEAVQNGCDGLHLAGNLWPELLGLEHHTHAYRYESLEADIRKALDTLDGSSIDTATREAILDLLPPSPEREIRFLRHFTFLSMLPRPPAPPALARASGSSGILLELQQRTPQSISTYYQETIRHFDQGTTVYDAIKTVNARIYQAQTFGDPGLCAELHAAGRHLIEQHPDSLILRFNYARFLYHQFNREEAMLHFAHIMREWERMGLREDEDDPLNYHYHNNFFPFMRYQDNVLMKLVAPGETPSPEWIAPKQVIASTACHYLADWLFSQRQTANALECASAGIRLDPGNYNLHAALVRICWQGWEDSGNQEFLNTLIECFDQAVDGFPGHFRDLAWFAWKAIEALQDAARGKRLLQLWYRWHARVLIADAAPLPPGQETELLEALRRYRRDLPEPIPSQFGELDTLLCSLAALAPDERIQLPAYFTVLFSNLGPIMLHALADAGRHKEAVDRLVSWATHLQLEDVPFANERLNHFHEQRIVPLLQPQH